MNAGQGVALSKQNIGHKDSQPVAKIHFVKDGKRANGERITKSFGISDHLVTAHLVHFGARYSFEPPTINPETVASDFAPYRHVVLEVEDSDTNQAFPEIGFYYILGLMPVECKRILDLPGATL